MKYMVGYQLSEDDDFINCIIENKDYVFEVYFSFGDFPNGRNDQTVKEGFMPWEAQEKQLKDLTKLSKAGISLNLLLNGNCYGENSQSRAFFNKIGDTADYLAKNFTLKSVTTTSILIAKFIKSNFAELEVRASVNMEIGSIQGMDYVKDYFDSYYMKRELNRNLNAIRLLKNWCDGNGKKLFMLANSGCLNNCSAHNFHDNLVAHEKDIAKMDNAYDFKGVCYDYLGVRENQSSFVRDTNYVRPEDMKFYDGYFQAAKLATRVNRNPVRVLRAYINHSYNGAVTELLEPDHSESLYPYILENKRFPDDFAMQLLSCSKDCQTCGYCKKVFENVLVKLDEEVLFDVNKSDD